MAPHTASVANDNTNAPSPALWAPRLGGGLWLEFAGMATPMLAASRFSAPVAGLPRFCLLQQGNSFIARSRWRPGRLEHDARHEVARMLCAARLTKDRGHMVASLQAN